MDTRNHTYFEQNHADKAFDKLVFYVIKSSNLAAKTLKQSGVSYMMRCYSEGTASAKKRHGAAGIGEVGENHCSS
jgi:hypothetical protein